MAIPFAVLAIGGSAGDVGYVAAAYLVPVIAFLLLGGVVADRLPRHEVMVAANALQAAAQAGSAVLLLTGDARVWELAVLAAARGVGSGFFFPASEGLLPQTVPADQRAQANAMDRIGRNGAQIGGAALGGGLVGLAGPGWALAVDAASFAAAAGLSVPAYSVFLFALAVPLAVPWVAAAAFLAGSCLEVFGVNWATTMQQEIPPHMLSRLSSYDALGSLALAPVGTAVAGPVAEAFGAPAVLAAGRILIVLLTAAVLLVPEVRHIQRQVTEHTDQAGPPVH